MTPAENYAATIKHLKFTAEVAKTQKADCEQEIAQLEKQLNRGDHLFKDTQKDLRRRVDSLKNQLKSNQSQLTPVSRALAELMGGER